MKYPNEGFFDSFHQNSHGELKNTYYNPFMVKHRRRTSKLQLKVLEKTFDTNIRPDAALRKALGEQLGMTPRAVQVWFQNRRAKIKKSSRQRQHPISDGGSGISELGRSQSGVQRGGSVQEEYYASEYANPNEGAAAGAYYHSPYRRGAPYVYNPMTSQDLAGGNFYPDQFAESNFYNSPLYNKPSFEKPKKGGGQDTPAHFQFNSYDANGEHYGQWRGADQQGHLNDDRGDDINKHDARQHMYYNK